MSGTESNPGGVLSLQDYLQVCEANRRTVRITATGKYGRGEIHVRKGRVIEARYGDLDGEEAALALMGEVELTYKTATDRVADAEALERGINTLLIASAQMSDEGRLPKPRRLQRQNRVAPIAIGAALAVVVIAGAAFALSRSEEPTSGPSRPAVSDTLPKKIAGDRPSSPQPNGALSPTVMLQLLVDETGAVETVETFQPRPELRAFETAAVAAAKTFRFEPGTKDGVPVRSWIKWPVTFRRNDAAPSTLSVKGSDTIGSELFPEIVEAFREEHPNVTVELQALGSSSGFAGLFDGTADVAMSSRPVSPAELAEASRLGIRLREFVLGYDGIALVVHADNPLMKIDLSDAARVFSGEIGSWEELGVSLGPIRVLSRPSYSGTHKFVVDHVLSVSGYKRFGQDVKFIERNEDLVHQVNQNPRAISYVGLASAMELKALSVSTMGSEPIGPNRYTVKDSLYPLTRPLHLYTRGTPRGAVADLVRFALSAPGQATVRAHGFVESETPAEALTFADEGPDRAPPTVTRIPFRFGKHQIEAEARETLEDLAKVLKRKGVRGLVVGNSDTVSEGKLNRDMSLKRARAVLRVLRQAGVPPTKLRMEAVSGERPLASNRDAAGRDENRRVDVFIIESE